MTGHHVLGLAVSIVILLTLFEMLRRHRLREKYALIWFVRRPRRSRRRGLPGLLVTASDLLDLQVPANLLFFVASLLLLA